MRTRKGIVLPVHVYSEEERQADDLGLPTDDMEEVVLDRTFYCIDSTGVAVNPKRSSVYSCGVQFLIDLTHEELQQKIYHILNIEQFEKDVN
tara:strand:+ start:755 stop:1030 length:276 start_codon:yes stop_codon:yes gene_type:complete